MKRKLDHNNVPAEVSKEGPHEDFPRFEDFKLDARLLRAITQQNFTRPTQVQAEAVPLALAGKDILGRDIPLVQI